MGWGFFNDKHLGMKNTRIRTDTEAVKGLLCGYLLLFGFFQRQYKVRAGIT
jgi:hypothetical protein